jgi:hypothetical protein
MEAVTDASFNLGWLGLIWGGVLGGNVCNLEPPLPIGLGLHI